MHCLYLYPLGMLSRTSVLKLVLFRERELTGASMSWLCRFRIHHDIYIWFLRGSWQPTIQKRQLVDIVKSALFWKREAVHFVFGHCKVTSLGQTWQNSTISHDHELVNIFQRVVSMVTLKWIVKKWSECREIHLLGVQTARKIIYAYCGN